MLNFHAAILVIILGYAYTQDPNCIYYEDVSI